jgi:AraC-like DNA-binding protein
MSNLISGATTDGRVEGDALLFPDASRAAVVGRDFSIQRDPHHFEEANEHAHEVVEMGILFDHGVGILTCSDATGKVCAHRLVAPVAYVVPAKLAHGTRWEVRSEIFCTHIKPAFWRRRIFAGRAPTLEPGVVTAASQDLVFWEFAALLRHVWDERREVEDEVALSVADGLLMRAGKLLVGDVRPEVLKAEGLSASRRTAMDQFIDRQIRFHLHAPDLARAVGLSLPHLTTLLKQSTGLTPHEYITQQRMKRAHQYLASGNYTLREVANAVGYEDADHFSQKFREYFNYPPRALMMRARHGQPQKIPEKP